MIQNRLTPENMRSPEDGEVNLKHEPQKEGNIKSTNAVDKRGGKKSTNKVDNGMSAILLVAHKNKQMSEDDKMRRRQSGPDYLGN